MMDVKEILTRCENAGMLRLGRPSGDWYMCHCPFHKDGQENRPSCGVSLKGTYERGKFNPPGTFHCFTCGSVKTMKETIEFLFNKYNPSPTTAQSITSLIEDVNYTYETVFDGNEIDQLTNLIRKKRSETIPYPMPSEEELASYRYTVQYMYDRKLNDDVISRFDVGFDPKFQPDGWNEPIPCVTFPVRNKQGKTLFIVRRSIEGKYFFMPERIKKPVYGLDTIPQNCNSICICESIFNALTCEAYGYPAVALLGTGDEYQYSQLSGLQALNFVICLDPDDAGDKGTRRLIKKFKSSRILWKMNIPKGKDVNDLTKEEFDYLYQHELEWV